MAKRKRATQKVVRRKVAKQKETKTDENEDLLTKLDITHLLTILQYVNPASLKMCMQTNRKMNAVIKKHERSLQRFKVKIVLDCVVWDGQCQPAGTIGLTWDITHVIEAGCMDECGDGLWQLKVIMKGNRVRFSANPNECPLWLCEYLKNLKEKQEINNPATKRIYFDILFYLMENFEITYFKTVNALHPDYVSMIASCIQETKAKCTKCEISSPQEWDIPAVFESSDVLMNINSEPDSYRVDLFKHIHEVHMSFSRIAIRCRQISLRKLDRSMARILQEWFEGKREIYCFAVCVNEVMTLANRNMETTAIDNVIVQYGAKTVVNGLFTKGCFRREFDEKKLYFNINRYDSFLMVYASELPLHHKKSMIISPIRPE